MQVEFANLYNITNNTDNNTDKTIYTIDSYQYHINDHKLIILIILLI